MGPLVYGHSIGRSQPLVICAIVYVPFIFTVNICFRYLTVKNDCTIFSYDALPRQISIKVKFNSNSFHSHVDSVTRIPYVQAVFFLTPLQKKKIRKVPNKQTCSPSQTQCSNSFLYRKFLRLRSVVEFSIL